MYGSWGENAIGLNSRNILGINGTYRAHTAKGRVRRIFRKKVRVQVPGGVKTLPEVDSKRKGTAPNKGEGKEVQKSVQIRQSQLRLNILAPSLQTIFSTVMCLALRQPIHFGFLTNSNGQNNGTCSIF